MKKIEYEKKYVFISNYYADYNREMENVIEALGLKDGKYVENNDTYYDQNNILEKDRISLRKRVCGDYTEFTVKKPLDYSSDISQRSEEDFSTLEEALNYIKSEFGIDITAPVEKIKLKTTRKKYLFEYGQSTFELVLDLTTPILNGVEFDSTYMIEIELKHGNSIDLNLINDFMKRFIFLRETNYSKKEIALATVGKKENINPFDNPIIYGREEYQEFISQFFVRDDDLLSRLSKLDEKKQEVKYLLDKFGGLQKPIVVTIVGTPRAGKTTTIDNLYEFFKKTNLRTARLEEPAGIIYSTLKTREDKKKITCR